MGDKSHVKLYSGLFAFLDERGRPLSEYGSAERGLGLADALAFLELLRINQVPLLGIELWRSVGSRLELDVSEIWYSNHPDGSARYDDAQRYFNRVSTRPTDAFAIQFG